MVARLSRVKVLVIGSGAREHAIVTGLARDSQVDSIVAAPGNPGMRAQAVCRPLPGGVDDRSSVVALAEQESPDLVVIGPEAPLVAGVADALRDAGFVVFGPSAQAARLEGSKAFAKEVMAAAGVPTARSHVCSTEEQVRDALDSTNSPYVVKDDGLAAGKGVVVTSDLDEAIDHARACFEHGSAVVVEEFLDGPEVSLFCITDGETVVPLAPAQDFKRVGDGDAGPNTGGMGAYSPLPWAPEGLVDDVVARVAQPTIDEMRRRGTPFNGVLYVGLALTARGPRVIEFNARFGDPETQVVLARLKTPLSALLDAAARGKLRELPALRWDPRSAVTVVIASEGYPAAPRIGDAITGIDSVQRSVVLHAGSALAEDDSLVSAGGRVLSVVALGDDLAAARAAAYSDVQRIDLQGSHYRSDIALKASRGEVEVP